MKNRHQSVGRRHLLRLVLASMALGSAWPAVSAESCQGMACAGLPGRYVTTYMCSPDENQSPLDHLAVQVRDQVQGWEEAWDQLCERLWPLLEQGLRRYCSGLDQEGCSLDDIRSELTYGWHQQAIKGSFLRNWTPGTPDGDGVAAYLCGRGMRKIAQQHCVRLAGKRRPTHQHIIGGAAGQLAMEQSSGADDAASSDDMDDKDRGSLARSAAPGPDRCCFRPLTRSGVTNAHLVAGVQLFPVLAWDHVPGPRVERQMPDFLPGADGPDWRQTLRAVHDEAQRDLAAQCCRLMDQISNDGKGVSARRKRECENRLVKVQAAISVLPIDAVRLMGLTRASRNTCDQHNARYRRALPKIIAWHDDPSLSAEDAS